MMVNATVTALSVTLCGSGKELEKLPTNAIMKGMGMVCYV